MKLKSMHQGSVHHLGEDGNPAIAAYVARLESQNAKLKEIIRQAAADTAHNNYHHSKNLLLRLADL